MNKFILFFGTTCYTIFSLSYIVYGFFSPSTQVTIAHFTGAVTLLTLLFVCLLTGFSYCQQHKWAVLLGFLGTGLLALGYFMYTFLHITSETSVASSLLFDAGTSLLTWSVLIFIIDIIKDKLSDKKD